MEGLFKFMVSILINNYYYSIFFDFLTIKLWEKVNKIYLIKYKLFWKLLFH